MPGFQHIPNGLVIPVLLASPRPDTGLVQPTADFVDRATILTHPDIHLLHNARFLKEDLKASFSTAFVLAHVAVAVGCMAENANPALLCRMSLPSPTAFEKLRALVFSNHPLDLQQ
jgi:hypothetical protein